MQKIKVVVVLGIWNIDLLLELQCRTYTQISDITATPTAFNGTVSSLSLRYYIIDLRVLSFMFNLSQASSSTIGPIIVFAPVGLSLPLTMGRPGVMKIDFRRLLENYDVIP